MSDRLRKIPSGAIVFREGESGDYACLVHAGTVELLRRRESDSVPFATVSVGHIFGEMALIDRAPRMATARAGSAGCEIAIVDRARFVVKLQGLSPKHSKLFEVFAGFIRETPVWTASRQVGAAADLDGRAKTVAALLATMEKSDQLKTGDSFVDLLLGRFGAYARARLPAAEAKPETTSGPLEPKARAV
jgi:CRP/FNR family transcriptional regulator, cyclic AMP receptor protein